MTVGERIQSHRKKQNLSQEELGQKLLVSRQTVSLWETDQTLPTVDNLRLLRDIFGISIDELLGVEPAPAPDEPTPLESYTFRHTREHLEEKFKSQRRPLLAYCCWNLFSIAILLMSVMQSDKHLLVCLALGFLAAVYAYRYFKAFWEHRKNHDSALNKVLSNKLTYNLFEDELHIKVQKGDECLESTHIPLDALSVVVCSKFYYEILYNSRNYLVPRSLFETEDAVTRPRLEALLKRVCISKKQMPLEGKWRTVLNVLFVLSLIAIVGAAAIFVVLLESPFEVYWKMYRNAWISFAFFPFALALLCMGIYWRRKGKRVLKNIVVGALAVTLMVVNGVTIYSDTEQHKRRLGEYIFAIEDYLDTELPDAELFTYEIMHLSYGNTHHFYSMYSGRFDKDLCGDFENQLSQDHRWLTELPSDLAPYTDKGGHDPEYDYILLYNITTDEFNTVPNELGEYDFICLRYDLETNRIQISDYTLTC